MSSSVEHVQDVMELFIERLGYSSAGIAHTSDGKTVFVEGAVPGDRVHARIVDNRKRFAQAEILEILEPSSDRVPPTCPSADTCGGCPWQQVAYEAQLAAKADNVKDALVRIGHLDPALVEKTFRTIHPSKRQWGYRNKIEFDTGQDAAGRFTLGAHRQSGEFVPLASCPLLPKAHAKAPKSLTGALRYLQGSEELSIERVGIRVSTRTKDVEVALWTPTGAFPRAAAAKILSSSFKDAGITRVMLKDTAKSRKVSGVETLSGKGCWSEKLCGSQMLLSAPSFFQVNTDGAEKLIELVMGHLQPDDAKTFFDLYSGAGTFTLPLAASGADVVAVETYGSSVRDLRRNLEMPGLYADVIGDDVARALPDLGPADGAVIDPPRSGLSEEVRNTLVENPLRQLVYVSCDPATLARDLAQLSEHAYSIQAIDCVDLFPHSYHVETVCLLVHRE